MIIDPYKFAAPGGGGGVTPIFTETFEGSESVSNATGTADNSGWVSDNSGNDFDYATSPAPLVGSYSLDLQDLNHRDVYWDLGSGYSEVWGWGVFASRAGNFGQETFLSLRSSGGTELARMMGRTNTKEFQVFAGGSNVESSGDLWADASAMFYLKWRYVAGSGSDAIMQIWFSTDGTFAAAGSPDLEATAGTSTADAQRLMLHGGAGMIFDGLALFDEDPGEEYEAP